MKFKTFTIHGTHKRTGEKKAFTIQAASFNDARNQLRQKFNQDWIF